jgi:ribulose bisphosphate carboxylase small subunit
MPHLSEEQHVKMARKKLRKPGDLQALRRKLWQAILEAERVLLTNTDDEVVLRAVHALSQAAGHYVRLLEADDIEGRLKTVETLLQTAGKRNGHVPVGAP